MIDAPPFQSSKLLTIISINKYYKEYTKDVKQSFEETDRILQEFLRKQTKRDLERDTLVIKQDLEIVGIS